MDPIKDYARAIAEVVQAEMREARRLFRPPADLDAIIATVPAPVMQRRDWPELTERDLREIALMNLITTELFAKHGVATPDLDLGVGEPAPDDGLTPEQASGKMSVLKLREYAPAPTPDIDPEKVRRALKFYTPQSLQPTPLMEALMSAAREWLRLREQPAPVMQHHAAPTCAGGWYVRNGDDEPWRLVEISQEHWRKQIGTRAYAQYYGPLLPPDTTEPAPDVQAQVVTFRTVALDDVAHLDCSVSVISERLKALRETMLQPNDEFVVAMFPALTWFNQWCKAQIPTLLAMRREMGFRWFRSDQEELCRAWDTHFGFIDKWLRDHSERLIASGQLPVPGNSTAPPSTTPQG